MIARWLRRAASLPLWLAAIGLFAMMILTFADVVLRSVASAPIPGAAELTELLLAAVVFLALPITSLDDRHISVDLLDAFFRPAILRLRDAVVNVVFGILLLWPVAACWRGAMRTLGYGEVTLYLRIPVGAVAIFIALGLAAGAVAMMLRGLLLVLRPHLLTQPHDHSSAA